MLSLFDRGLRRGGGRGLKPPTSHTLLSRLLPNICWLPTLYAVLIAKYCVMLHHFPYFPASRQAWNAASPPPPLLRLPYSIHLSPPFLPVSHPLSPFAKEATQLQRADLNHCPSDQISEALHYLTTTAPPIGTNVQAFFKSKTQGGCLGSVYCIHFLDCY